jgi:acyl-CoA thioesterase-1
MLAPRNLGSDYVTAFDGPVQANRRKVSVPLYPFILDGVAQDPAFIQADGIHPNPKGAQVVADRLLPFVTKTLDDYAAAVHRPARP